MRHQLPDEQRRAQRYSWDEYPNLDSRILLKYTVSLYSKEIPFCLSKNRDKNGMKKILEIMRTPLSSNDHDIVINIMELRVTLHRHHQLSNNSLAERNIFLETETRKTIYHLQWDLQIMASFLTRPSLSSRQKGKKPDQEMFWRESKESWLSSHFQSNFGNKSFPRRQLFSHSF